MNWHLHAGFSSMADLISYCGELTSLMRLHTCINALLEWMGFFSSKRWVWSFGKAKISPYRVRLRPSSIFSYNTLCQMTTIFSELCRLTLNAHRNMLSYNSKIKPLGWVHRRLWSSDSCSQSKAGLGTAYRNDALIKMGKEGVWVQEGRKELIYDEAKAADLKEIIILL